jgi:flagellar motility protein MotE (MotC chaperone)
MLMYIALLLIGAGPVEPTPPRLPAVPEARAPAPAGADSKARELVAVERLDAGAAAEERPAVSDRRPAEARAHAGTASTPPVPPSLTRKALCGEFVKTGKDIALARKKLEEDRKALDVERQTLERLKAEIGDARIHLRLETERLEKLLAKRSETATAEPERGAPATPEKVKPPPPVIRPQELDALARTIKSMKPEAAAALIQKTELPLAAAVLKRMKAGDAGAVMDKLKPDHAAELVALMATLVGPPAKGGRP